jgi:hypothetical protein
MGFIGLDVHRTFAEVAVLAEGQVHAAGQVTTTALALEAFARTLRADDQVVLEATLNTQAIVRILRPHVGRVAIANSLRTRLIAEAKIKTDKIDAAVLAQLLAAGFLPEVWMPDETTAALRRRVARRTQLVRQERAVLDLPLVGQPRDVGGGQPGRIVPEQRRQGLAEVARGEAAQVEHGQHLGHLRGAPHVRRQDAGRCALIGRRPYHERARSRRHPPQRVVGARRLHSSCSPPRGKDKGDADGKRILCMLARKRVAPVPCTIHKRGKRLGSGGSPPGAGPSPRPQQSEAPGGSASLYATPKKAGEFKMPRGGQRPGAGRKPAPGESFEAARRRKESALADLRGLEVHRRRGEVIEVAVVRRVIDTAARGYRASWLNWPARVAAVLAAGWGIDGAQVHRDLEDAVRAHLTELADLTVAGAFD